MSAVPVPAPERQRPQSIAPSGSAARGLNIRQRLSLIVVGVSVPMLLLSAGIVWQLAEHQRETSRQALMYSARSIMSAVDAQLGKYIAIAETLAASPSLQAHDLVAFRKEAERALPALGGAWVLVADAQGQQVLNTLIPAGQPLPRTLPETLADRAFATKHVQVSNVAFGPVARTPAIGVGVPIFRGAQPDYYLMIVAKAVLFRDLLNHERLPEGWGAGIIDRAGNLVARSIDHERFVGSPAAPDWRAVMRQEMTFEMVSLDGLPFLEANAPSSFSGWAVAVGVEKSALEAPIRRTVALASLAAFAVTVASILLAMRAAKKIAAPIRALEAGAAALQAQEPAPLAATGVPEVDSALRAFDAASRRLAANESALRESEQRVRRKLASVLSPEGDRDVLDLANLIDAPALQKMMEDFYVLARIPMSILDVGGRVLVGVGWQDVCTRFHRVNEATCRHCHESDTQLSAGLEPGEDRLYKCKNNLWDMATPIFVGGRHVGNVFTGQFFFDDEPVDRELFRSQARRYGFDESEYLAALDRVPRLGRATVDRGMAFLVQLADMLSQVGHSNIKLARLLTERDRLTASLRESEERLRRDIGERKQAEDALRQSEARLQSEAAALAQLNAASSRLWAIRDLRTGLDEVLAAAIDLLGADMGSVRLLDAEREVLEVAAHRGFPPNHFDLVGAFSPDDAAAAARALRSGQRVIIEDVETDSAYASYLPTARAAGYRAVQSTPLHGHDGTPLGMISTFFRSVHRPSDEELRRFDLYARQASDFIVRHRTDEALRLAEERRQALQSDLFHASRLSEIGRMATAMAHELNQPLAAVSNYIGGCRRILASGIDDEPTRRKLQEKMEQAGAQALRAGDVIRRLREYVGSGQRERSIEDAASVMHEACSLAITSARHNGVSVETAIGEAGHVLVDKIQFQQVIINLARNAVEAMEESPRKELAFRLARNGDHIEVSVSDTGSGLDPDIADRLFTPFSTTKEAGMGIGLSVCREIVEAHDGRIWCEPNSEGGTVFRFTLPIVAENMVA